MLRQVQTMRPLASALWLTIFAALAADTDAMAQEAASRPLPLGIVDAKPARGRFVDLGDGTWMVPYRETIADGLSFQMVPIAGGVATIGSPGNEPGRNDDEGPQVQVTIAPYWIGAMEVSWNEYSMYEATHKIFVEQSRHRKPDDPPIEITRVDAVTAPTQLYEPDFTREFGADSHPAVSMTHFGAMQYSKWLTLTTGNQYRLPTEAEWEHACRAGTMTAYSCGEDVTQLSKIARYLLNEGDTIEGPLPVGSLEPNAWGLHDMHGNVAEWVIDQYHADAYKQWSLQLCSELKRTRMCIEVEAASIRLRIFDRPDVLHRQCLSWIPIPTAREVLIGTLQPRLASLDFDWQDRHAQKKQKPSHGSGTRILRSPSMSKTAAIRAATSSGF